MTVLQTYIEIKKAISSAPDNAPIGGPYDVDGHTLHEFDASKRSLVAALLTIATILKERAP